MRVKPYITVCPTLHLTVELQSDLNYAIASHRQPKILLQLWHNFEHTQPGRHGREGEVQLSMFLLCH